jgi:uncharacterized protein (DUF3820 family)
MDNLMIIDSIDNAGIITTLKKISEFQALVQATLKPGHDYDTIPGTNKPTLLKPGAEKIGMLMGVNPEYDFLKCEEDYKAEFFSYNIKCTLFRNGQPVAQGVGNCNSKEKKYRYLNMSEADLPAGIDKSTLETTTDKYGRLKYKMDNPDICSLVNTILKMAKKRAYVDATLQLAALSEIFTQDVEDMKELIKNEQSDNMTVEEAANMKISFGKHKGKTLGEIYKQSNDYVQWFLEKGTDPIVKKAFELLNNAAKEAHEKKNKPEDKYEGSPLSDAAIKAANTKETEST